MQINGPRDEHLLSDTITRVFAQLGRAIARRAAEPDAVQRTDYGILVQLDRAAQLGRDEDGSGGMRVGEVAALDGSDMSTVSRRIKALHDGGLVTREPDPGDRRAALLHLTDAGRAALARERAARAALVTDVVGDWSDADLADLDRVLSRLADDLAVSNGCPAPALPGRTA